MTGPKRIDAVIGEMKRDGIAPFVAQETIGGAVMGVGGDEWRDLQARCNGPRPSAWIDVRERLPETSVDVLAWEDYSAIPDGWSGVSVCVYKTAEWQDGEGFPATVTHWQPLPPPPEVKRYPPFDTSLLDGSPPTAERLAQQLHTATWDRTAFAGWLHEPVILTCPECCREEQIAVAVPIGSKRVSLPALHIGCRCGFNGVPSARYADEVKP